MQQRVTQQKIQARFNELKELYNSDYSALQTIVDGKLLTQEYPSRIVRFSKVVESSKELFDVISKVAIEYPELKVTNTNYDSIITKGEASYFTVSLYLLKSELMVNDDLKELQDIAEVEVKRDVELANEQSKKNQEAELLAIQETEKREILEQAQIKQDKKDRAKRKAELERSLGLVKN